MPGYIETTRVSIKIMIPKVFGDVSKEYTRRATKIKFVFVIRSKTGKSKAFERSLERVIW